MFVLSSHMLRIEFGLEHVLTDLGRCNFQAIVLCYLVLVTTSLVLRLNFKLFKATLSRVPLLKT